MTVTNILLLFAAIPLAGFIYFYGRYSPWQSTIQGRTLITQKAAMLALVLFYLSASILGDYPGKEIVKTILIAVLVILFWVMFITLRLAQSAHKPVSKKRGSGYVASEDLEQTRPRVMRRRPTKKKE